MRSKYTILMNKFSDQLIPDGGELSFYRICEVEKRRAIYCVYSISKYWGSVRIFLYKASIVDTGSGEAIRLASLTNKDLEKEFTFEILELRSKIKNFKESLRKIPKLSYFLRKNKVSITRNQRGDYVITVDNIIPGLRCEGVGLSIEDAYTSMWVNFLRDSELDILGISNDYD